MGADSGISEELEEDSRSSSIEKAESESGVSSANVNQDADGKKERGDVVPIRESALHSV